MVQSLLRGLSHTNDGDGNTHNGDSDGLGGQQMVFALTVFAISFLILVFRNKLRNVKICPNWSLCIRLEERRRQRHDLMLAQILQQRLNEETADLEATRKDRKEWYENFVKPYTVTIKREDFLDSYENDLSKSDHSSIKTLSTDYNSDMDLKMDTNIDESYNKVRIQCQEGKSRCIDAQCAICVSNYEEGDRVVCSGLACSHAFHYECILPWLIKGKKRCPICRDWFVPGEKIEDQKNELQRRIDQESISQNEESDNVIIEVYEPEAEPEAEDASNGEDFVRREEQNTSEEEETQVLSA